MTESLNAHVIGHPIGHSRSPIIHGYWLATYGISGSYTARDVAPGADLERFFGDMRAGASVGCNVTIPHKMDVASLVDEVLPEARALGSINTVWREDDRLIATSTDGLGYLAHLNRSAPQWRDGDGPVYIIGAGGAARAIINALINDGCERFSITNRTAERTNELIAAVNASARSVGLSSRLEVTAQDWGARDAAVSDAALIINTTALGMTGQPALDLDLASAADHCVVSDIVYAPLETPLLLAARQRDLKTVDGLGMLLHQAVPGFEKWFGVRPDVTNALRDRVLADLV